MALIEGVGQKKEGGSSFSELIRPESGMQICRISPEKGESMIRIIPERHADGTLRPMLNGTVGTTNDWSNVCVVSITALAGERGDKLTVINEPSDSTGGGAPQWPLSGLYIRLKGMQKQKQLPAHAKERVDRLLEGKGERNFGGLLPKPQDMVAVQAIVKQINGKTLDKASPKQVVLMSGTTAESLSKVLSAALAAGLDVFGPNGYWIKFVPEIQRGSEIKLATAVLGDPCPAAETTLRPMWVPWEQVWVRKTRRELLISTIRAFDKEVVRLVFPEEVEELMAEQVQARSAVQASSAPATAPVAVTAAAPPAAPPAPPKAAPAVAGLEDILASGPTDLSNMDAGTPSPAGAPAAKLPSAQERALAFEKALKQDLKDLM